MDYPISQLDHFTLTHQHNTTHILRIATIHLYTGTSSIKDWITQNIYEKTFRETYLLKLFENKNILTTANVWLGNKSKVNLTADKPFKVLVNRSSLRMIKTKLVWNDPIRAPIKIGQEVGKINIQIPGRNLIQLNLVSKDNIEDLGPIDKLKSAINYLLFGGDLN